MQIANDRQGPVYADVGYALSLNANANISMSLDDDYVQYVHVKHQVPDANHNESDSGMHIGMLTTNRSRRVEVLTSVLLFNGILV